jgi:hypothetical protein
MVAYSKVVPMDGLAPASWKKGRRSVGGVRDANGSDDRRGVGVAVSRSPPRQCHDAPVPGQRRRREAGKVRLLKSRQRRGGQRLARGVRRLATRLVAASRVVMGVSERGSGDAASLAGP